MIENDLLWDLSQKNFRKPTRHVEMSFGKVLDPTIAFLTYDSGMNYDDKNIYRSDTEDVLQQWDQYVYTDYSSRVLDVNWKRVELQPASVAFAQADVVFNNIDNIFSPDNEDSPIYPYVRDSRPIRISAGFEGVNVRQFIGLTQGLPVIDDNAKTATFHCLDFLSVIVDTPITRSVMLVDFTVSEIIEYVLTTFGLVPDQYDIAPSVLKIPFFYLKAQDKCYGALKDLVTAEVGSLYMDETGLVKFLSAGGYTEDVVAEFSTANNIYDLNMRRNSGLINKVKLTSVVRQVVSNVLILEVSGESVFPPGNTILWFDLQDPVVSLEEPDYGITGSRMVISTASDDTGVESTDMTIDDFTVFATSVKITFNNPTADSLYLKSLILFGDPAIQTDPINVEMSLDDSIEMYGEYLLELDSEYIGSASNALNVASVVLVNYGRYAGNSRIEVRGTPQLQLGDVLKITKYGVESKARIIQIENTQDTNGFSQTLQLTNVIEKQFLIYDEGMRYDVGNVYAL